MANIGDTVIYHPGTAGRETCEATITKVNDDGTVNIAYPHFADASVMASADNCQWGAGGYQVDVLPEPEAASASAPDLSSLTRAELEAQAVALGLDVSGAKNKAEIVDLIQPSAEPEAAN